MQLVQGQLRPVGHVVQDGHCGKNGFEGGSSGRTGVFNIWGVPDAGEGLKHLRGRSVRQTKDLDFGARASGVWKNFPAIPLVGGSSHQEWIACGVVRVGPLGVGGSEAGVTGVVVATLTSTGGRQRSLEPDFVKEIDAWREEAAVLLVETEAAERLARPLFWGGFWVVPREWQSLLVKAQESGVLVGAQESLVGRVVVAEDSLVVAGALADMVAMAAQVFGKGIWEDDGAEGKAQRKVRLLGICERSIAGEKQSGCETKGSHQSDVLGGNGGRG